MAKNASGARSRPVVLFDASVDDFLQKIKVLLHHCLLTLEADRYKYKGMFHLFPLPCVRRLTIISTTHFKLRHFMDVPRPIVEWMRQREVAVAGLVQTTGLDKKVVEAIVSGQYTPSPRQRERLAMALSVEVSDIRWGHTVPVDHMYGHGTQFGRSP